MYESVGNEQCHVQLVCCDCRGQGGDGGGGEEESVDRAGDTRSHQKPEPRALETHTPHGPLPQR